MVARYTQILAGQQKHDGEQTPALECMRVGGSGWPPQQRCAITSVLPRLPARVLVIDESLTVRMVVKTCLKRAGCEVIDFPDGVQALSWLRSAEQIFSLDVILLDLEIPKMDWYLVMQHLKAHPACADTTLVVLSRRDGLLDRLKARLAGAHSYLVKPFRTQDLLNEIHHRLSGHEPLATGDAQ